MWLRDGIIYLHWNQILEQSRYQNTLSVEKRRSKVKVFVADQNIGRPSFRLTKFSPTKQFGQPSFRLTKFAPTKQFGRLSFDWNPKVFGFLFGRFRYEFRMFVKTSIKYNLTLVRNNSEILTLPEQILNRFLWIFGKIHQSHLIGLDSQKSMSWENGLVTC